MISDSALTTRLGGERVYDEAPQNAQMPYVVFGEAQAKDWSTSGDSGSEHRFAVDIWSEHRGVSEALEISSLVASAIAAAAPSVADHRLISIAPLSLETRREQNGRRARARQIFRAVLEKI